FHLSRETDRGGLPPPAPTEAEAERQPGAVPRAIEPVVGPEERPPPVWIAHIGSAPRPVVAAGDIRPSPIGSISNTPAPVRPVIEAAPHPDVTTVPAAMDRADLGHACYVTATHTIRFSLCRIGRDRQRQRGCQRQRSYSCKNFRHAGS